MTDVVVELVETVVSRHEARHDRRTPYAAQPVGRGRRPTLRSPMDLTDARTILDAVETTATRLGLSLSTSVVDAAGHELLTARMPGAPWFTPHVCRTKARTSVALGMDSAAVADLATAYPDLVPVIDEQLPFTLTTLAGGVVVTVDDAVVGAVACSGATPAQDEACARAGIDAWLAARG